MVSKVYENTAADKAGLRAADIIIKAGNQLIKTNSQLRNALNEPGENEAVEIELYRKGKLQKIKVLPDKREGLGIMVDRFRDLMGDINIRIDEDKLKRIEEEGLKSGQVQWENYLKENDLYEKVLRKYKEEIETMRQTIKKLQQQLEQVKREKTATTQ